MGDTISMLEIQNTSENRLPPRGSRVVIAMSGGVDSAASAAFMVEAGYACMGITLQMMQDVGTHIGIPVSDEEDKTAVDARHICGLLNIPHKTVNVAEAFERHIIARFVREYVSGRTPNPCIRCNRMIKFGLLFKEARRLGYDYVATGHYARLVDRDGRLALRRAVHLPKDQTYVLAPLTQAQLRRACFPLGSMSKADAREAAGKLDPAIAAKKESQEICFVADKTYVSILEGRQNIGKPGLIKDLRGTVLGTHAGIHRYTIGQRHGLGVSAERPLYVVRLDPQENTVYVGFEEDSLCGAFQTGPLFWGGIGPQHSLFRAEAQIRYKHRPAPCIVTPLPGSAEVHLEESQRAVTPGQWVAFYDPAGFLLASAEIRKF